MASSNAAAPPGVRDCCRVTVFFLHGFGSSPRSTKAGYFAKALEPLGIALRCPDLNAPDFRALTMTRMLEQLEGEFETAPGPVTLMGSSLGGTLAILAAARYAPRVDRLVLLAPAVRFGDPDHHLLPAGKIAEWKARGEYDFFYYAEEAQRPLAYGFYEDSLKYDAFGTLFTQPTLIFQGQRDTLVDPRAVEQFAAARPNVTLSLLDDDHQLIASLPQIWNDVRPFLGLK
jgi:pimeloyl-ACP methyl ester carboxylesterase